MSVSRAGCARAYPRTRWRWPALLAYFAFAGPLFGPRDPELGYAMELARGLLLAWIVLMVVGTMVWQLRGSLERGSWREAAFSLTTVGVAFGVGLAAEVGRMLVVHMGPAT
jgi:hypothetical protein